LGIYLGWVFNNFASQICEIMQNFQEIQTEMGNNPVGLVGLKRKVNTRVFTFLYLGFTVAESNNLFTFGSSFLRYP